MKGLVVLPSQKKTPQELDKLKATTIEMMWDRDLEVRGFAGGTHETWHVAQE